jgi:hypothetical protein
MFLSAQTADPELKAQHRVKVAWFQPLEPITCENLVSKFCFHMGQLVTLRHGRAADADGGPPRVEDLGPPALRQSRGGAGPYQFNPVDLS